MREYSDKKNAQKKHYYKDRFYVAPQTQKTPVDDEKFIRDLDALKLVGVEILNSYIELDTLVIYVKSDENFKAIKAMRDCGYELLCEISAVDFLAVSNKFEIFYQLLSVGNYRRARVKCELEDKKHLLSVSSLYKNANWAEREMYDMFGIMILNHPNLKRILMPDDWISHPLLKSYPLQGDENAQWYEVDKIFGKEFRDEIGKENRDPAKIDSKDTFEFSRIFHEVPFGAPPRSDKFKQEYQEDGGVAFVKKVKRDTAEILEKRP
ncbi:MAG: NADH-quinone oxidoreductase subunit C [Campylobacter sp.]